MFLPRFSLPRNVRSEIHFLGLVLAITTFWSVPVVAQPGVPNLVAAYNFNQGSGTTLSDVSGNNLNGTLSGPTWTTEGRFGGALTFDGVNDWVTVPDNNALDLTTGMTLEAWVYPTAAGSAPFWRNVMIKERSGGESYNLYAADGANVPVAYVVRAAQTNTPLDAKGTTGLPLNTWSHLAVTYDGANLRLYVNGTQVGTRAVSGALVTTTGPLRIGGNSIWGEYFQGRIDEIRIYNRALTVAELQTDMLTPVATPGPDTTPPILSNGSPSGTLPANTTQVTLSLTTNEAATCRYDTTAGLPYESMAFPFTTTGTTSHSTLFTGLTNGSSYFINVRCQDAAGNSNPAELVIFFSVATPPADTTPPVLANGAPTGVLPFGTTQTTLAVTTNEAATCRYSSTPNVPFASMTTTFATTGGTSHSSPVSGLTNGSSYTYYLRCADAAGNATVADFPVSFSVASSAADTTPPTVSITSPAAGATVAGIVTVTAVASDNVGVAGVQFLLDGANLGSEDTTAPYSVSWNTTTLGSGSHILTARARDTSGNTAVSAQVGVAVANNPVPPNFQDEVFIGAGLTFPTAFEFLPDGRMLITEFTGRIVVVQPGATTIDPTPVLQLTNFFHEDVTIGGERGLVNVVADPNFASNGYIYIFYTAASPQRDRVSRFTMVGNTASLASELVVWQGAANSTSSDHHGGGLAFGPDGKLYIGTGDNGDPPTSQPLTSDHGKILRVNPDGTVPTDNPFYDGNGPNIDAIWARGLRNPYRFSFDSATSRLYIGDVGFNSIEEINRGVAGANYGWPTCEGSCSTAGMTNPIFQYPHNGRDSAVTGGFVYRGTQFPPEYRGAYFYGDFAQNWIRYLTLNEAGAVTGGGNFLPADGSTDGPYDPVMLKMGPDGSLYYVDFGWGWQSTANPASIRRIKYNAGDQPPVARASATPQAGPAPLTVSFSSGGSIDPDGLPLTYSWTFGDGGVSTLANPQHTYVAPGTYNVQLTVSDGNLSATSDPITIVVGNPPTPMITTPIDGRAFRANDVISFAGSAIDEEDGTLPASALSWTVLFHHDSHVHPAVGPLNGTASGSFAIPSTGHDFIGNTSYEIILTATDSHGLQSSTSVYVYPEKALLTFITNPPGLQITIDGINRTTPYSHDGLVGFQYAIGAPSQTLNGVVYNFDEWSDGGAATHTLTVPEGGATLAATYVGTADGVVPTVSITSPVGGSTVSGSTVITATAADNVGVTGVQFLLDGSPLGPEDTVAPFSIGWNTTTTTNGTHQLSAQARDAAGNLGVAVPINVVVSNGSLGLVAAYSFDEGSGTTVSNAASSNHTGTISGASWNTSGRFGGSLTFDGINDWVTVPDANPLDLTTGMTIEAWINPTAAGSGAAWRNVLIKERPNGEAYNLYAGDDANLPVAYVVRSAATNQPLGARGTSSVPLNSWTHLAATHDGSNLRLFVNGTQVATQAVSGALVVSTGALRIGGNSIWGEFFQGRIDEVRIYNRALTADQIRADMVTPIATSAAPAP